ncbi:hypothetical protein PFBG_05713 [Plasmodium falciparum 7G8]|uniref:C2H2-type domain-containing protein n=2 Tax=Plasmodium falciparum TaxID=5833 RepID=A0A024WHV4_PLAFA|nr:hypothetical protein PFMALIP_05481 [Plasmodium falciparum MaliPS096_E11]EUR62503.1 hypothetical protein PFBG_05713 [Plasmodium falciparum 7G8]
MCVFLYFIFLVALSTRKKKNPRNTIKSKILKTRKRKRDYDQGQFKCFACDIYFINNDAKIQHEKSKKHKRRVKQLNQEKAHTYKDALRAAEITF